jgi:hypothetical protein
VDRPQGHFPAERSISEARRPIRAANYPDQEQGARHAMTIQVTMHQEKTTPGTIRYAEDHPDTEPPKSGTLYIKKHAAAQLGNPQKITVTVEAAG